jgi:two-component system, LytTR family, response regulator
MRVLIVDDEAPARDRLARLLKVDARITWIGQADSAKAALAMVGEHSPDLLLLDIQMPEVTGLEVAASLPAPAPAVVFVTAYDRYALAAFEAAAVDYLLKPVAPEKLSRAVTRAMASRQVPVAGIAGHSPLAAHPVERLLVPDRGRTVVVLVDDIFWLEAMDNYVALHTAAGAPLLRRTLEALLADLGPRFARCHRSAAVALTHVAGVAQAGPDARSQYVISLSGGVTVPCSRSYRAGLLAQLAPKKPPSAPFT